MHEALTLIANAISLAHDRWRSRVGRRRPLSGKIAVLEERIQRLDAEYTLVRTRLWMVSERDPPNGHRT